MAGRDDSVIRGSLITCLILLVLSIALNIFLYIVSDRNRQELASKDDRLSDVQNSIRDAETKLTRLKAMLGQGAFSQAELDDMQLQSSQSDDTEIQAIEKRFARDMAMFDSTIQAQDRNYPALPEYLNVTLRNRNEQLINANSQAETIRADAEADVANATKAKELAEKNAADLNTRVVKLDDEYAQERARMNDVGQKTRDRLTIVEQDMSKLRSQSRRQVSVLKDETNRLKGTIDEQKKKINEMTNPQFEVAQGRVGFIANGGEFVTINLGTADSLRPNVTFGVIDQDEIRLQDAKVKANLQVVKVSGPHLATARVIRNPELGNPIIPGDKIYSPFWAPGRTVKIALAGDLDFDEDGRSDNEIIKGQIRAAGAEVVAELTPSGMSGKLDSDVRFLVVGSTPELSPTGDFNDGPDEMEVVQEFGRIKTLAGELGITIIPLWKLQAYLRTIDDSLTTPLGSAVRGDDFLPESRLNVHRLPSDIAEIYERQREGIQRGNEIVP